MATEGLRQRVVDAVDGETKGVISSKQEMDKKAHPAGAAKHGALEQALRIVLLVLYFIGSCVRYGINLPSYPGTRCVAC